MDTEYSEYWLITAWDEVTGLTRRRLYKGRLAGFTRDYTTRAIIMFATPITKDEYLEFIDDI